MENVLDDAVDVQVCWHPWSMVYLLLRPHNFITSSSPKAFPRSSRDTRASTKTIGVSLRPRKPISMGISKSVKDKCNEVPVNEFQNSPSKGKWLIKCHDAGLYSFNLGLAGETKNAIPGLPRFPRTRWRCVFDVFTVGSANNAESTKIESPDDNANTPRRELGSISNCPDSNIAKEAKHRSEFREISTREGNSNMPWLGGRLGELLSERATSCKVPWPIQFWIALS